MSFGMIIGEALFDPAGAVADLEKMQRTAQYNAEVSHIHQQTAGGGSGDVHVEMEYLVDFYNTLSQLHDELATEIKKLADFADGMYGKDYAGEVPGVRQAWLAMTRMIGANKSTQSLAGNLQAFDNEVVKCMEALHHNANSYATNEQGAIEGFGRAVGTGPVKHKKHPKGHGTTHGSTHQATPAAAKSTTTSTGLGGHG